MLTAEPIAEAVIDGLPESVFGHDDWAAGAVHRLAEHLLEALETGRNGRYIQTVRTLAHVPAPQDVRAIANAVCDSASTFAVLSSLGSTTLQQRLASLRDMANATLDLATEDVAHASTSPAAVIACDTLLQVAAINRSGLVDHLRAVSALAVRVSRDLGLEEDAVERARLTGLLHDVGCLTAGVDGEDEAEHAALGERCLGGIASLAHIAPLVRAHHEYFDGSGVPDGLRGAEIPIESRVIAVADAFERDANRSGRSNPIVATIGSLWTLSGVRYDPEVVASITRIFRQPRLNQRAASGSS